VVGPARYCKYICFGNLLGDETVALGEWKCFAVAVHDFIAASALRVK
jgi:hypothetical protein